MRQDDFQPGGDRFPLTRRSVIEAARCIDAQERERALEALCAAYWRPVYKYVRWRWNRPVEAAQEDDREAAREEVEPRKTRKTRKARKTRKTRKRLSARQPASRATKRKVARKHKPLRRTVFAFASRFTFRCGRLCRPLSHAHLCVHSGLCVQAVVFFVIFVCFVSFVIFFVVKLFVSIPAGCSRSCGRSSRDRRRP